MNQNNFHKDEMIVDEIITTFKTVVLNIFVFILCIFLFMNPYLLSNVVLFISVFAFIKVSISFFSSSFETQQSLLEETQPLLAVRMMDEEENEILRNKVRKLKKDNTLLKDKLENKLKRKMKTSTPKIVSNPIEINVQFEEKDENAEIDVSIEKEIKETLKSEEDLLEENLNNEENLSILDKEDEWST